MQHFDRFIGCGAQPGSSALLSVFVKRGTGKGIRGPFHESRKQRGRGSELNSRLENFQAKVFAIEHSKTFLKFGIRGGGEIGVRWARKNRVRLGVSGCVCKRECQTHV